MVLTRSSMLNVVINTPEQMVSFAGLPTEILENILGFLPYKNAASLRLVSTRLNAVTSEYLSHSFQRIQKIVGAKYQALKVSLPRRDSVRRTHPLSNDLEILEMVQARLGLLQLGMGKSLAQNQCHFFAAEVLDESLRVLDYVSKGGTERPYRVTEELFDLTSMAIDFFKEHIAPTLPELNSFTATDKYYNKLIGVSPTTMDQEYEFSPPSTSRQSSPPAPTPAPSVDHKMCKVVQHISKTLKRKSKALMALKRKHANIVNVVADHDEQLANLASRMEESEKNSADCTVKLAIVKQEIDKCKAAILISKRGPNMSYTCCSADSEVPEKYKKVPKEEPQEKRSSMSV